MFGGGGQVFGSLWGWYLFGSLWLRQGWYLGSRTRVMYYQTLALPGIGATLHTPPFEAIDERGLAEVRIPNQPDRMVCFVTERVREAGVECECHGEVYFGEKRCITGRRLGRDRIPLNLAHNYNFFVRVFLSQLIYYGSRRNENVYAEDRGSTCLLVPLAPSSTNVIGSSFRMSKAKYRSFHLPPKRC